MINGIKNWKKVKERKYEAEGQGDYACQGAAGGGSSTWGGPLGGDSDSKMVRGTDGHNPTAAGHGKLNLGKTGCKGGAKQNLFQWITAALIARSGNSFAYPMRMGVINVWAKLSISCCWLRVCCWGFGMDSAGWAVSRKGQTQSEDVWGIVRVRWLSKEQLGV